MPLTGTAFHFGDGVTTDDILPGRYLDRASHEVAAFAMAGVDPEFARKVKPGDFIVAGRNFGAGSGRESAPAALKGAGVAAVIAVSFSRLFFRNCVNLGLPPLIVDDTADLREGDQLTVDLERRTIHSGRTGTTRPIRNLTGISQQILQAGGIMPFVRQLKRRS
jgi:3-isopropylmalate/(R)-2-methylmalate dehydratase small subunit